MNIIHKNLSFDYADRQEAKIAISYSASISLQKFKIEDFSLLFCEV